MVEQVIIALTTLFFMYMVHVVLAHMMISILNQSLGIEVFPLSYRYYSIAISIVIFYILFSALFKK